MAIFRYISVSAALIAAVILPLARGGEALTVDCRHATGQFAGAGALAFETDGGPIALAEIARVVIGDYYAAVPIVAGVRLAGGAEIRGAVEIGDDGVAVDSARLGPLHFAWDDVAAVYLSGNDSAPGGGRKGLLLTNGDFLACESITAAAAGFTVNSALGMVEVPAARVAAAFIRECRPAGAARVILDNGDIINGALSAVGEERFVVTAGAMDFSIPKEYVARVDFPERIRYLCAVANGCRGACTDLRVRPGAPHAVELPPGARTLHFTPALAADSNPRSAVFTVTAGDQTLWSGEVTGGDAPERAVIPLGGRGALELGFESNPPGLAGARGVWADSFVVMDGGR